MLVAGRALSNLVLVFGIVFIAPHPLVSHSRQQLYAELGSGMSTEILVFRVLAKYHVMCLYEKR